MVTDISHIFVFLISCYIIWYDAFTGKNERRVHRCACLHSRLCKITACSLPIITSPSPPACVPLPPPQGPGADSAAFQEMLNDVAVTGFGRCSIVNHTRRSEPFLNRLSVVPVVNRTYQIPRMTHLLWTCRATFQGCCNPPAVPSGPFYPPFGGLETLAQAPPQPTPIFTKPSLPLPTDAGHSQSRRSARASTAASAGRFAAAPCNRKRPRPDRKSVV